MRRVIPIISVCLVLAAAAESASAQQRLFARTEQEIVELDPRSASLGTVIRRFPLPDEANLHPSSVPRIAKVVSFGGGAFLAWVGQGVVLLNTRSGAVQRFAFPDFFPTRVIGTDGNSRLLILGTNVSQHDVVLVADVRSASTHFLDLGSTKNDMDAAEGGYFKPRALSGRVDVVRRGDTFDAHTRGVREFRLLLSPDVIDFTRPVTVTVTVNRKKLFDGAVKKDPTALLAWAAKDNDRTMLYGAELRTLVQ